MNTTAKPPALFANAIVKAWGDNFPLKVKEIALQFSQSQKDRIVKIEPLDIEGVEGFLGKSKKTNTWGIGYSQSIREPGKINFTVAHELGHYMLHRADRDRIVCVSDDMSDFSKDDKSFANIEQEANEFSSYLLMPIHDFRKQVNGHRATLELVDHCARRYDATITAAAIKFISFSEKALVVIAAKDGTVKWSSSSKAALKRGFFFRKGATIPDGTETNSCHRGGCQISNLKGAAADPKHWSNDTGWVHESVVAQRYYGSTLTLLEFES